MMTTPAPRLKLDLGILLPNAPGEADACVWRLLNDLGGRPGIGQVHVLPATGEHPAQLCIHYDPTVATLARVREIAESSGAKLTQRFGHVLWDVEGLQDERRARTVTDLLSRLPGVMEADASAAGPVRIEFDRTATSENALRSALGEMGVSARGGVPPTACARIHPASAPVRAPISAHRRHGDRTSRPAAPG